MIVSNRKLFKKRPARDNLNQAAGIMANSITSTPFGEDVAAIMKQIMDMINQPSDSEKPNSISNRDAAILNEIRKERMGRIYQPSGIMASSPELMGEVQGFDNGGNVQLPGSVGSIVQMLDTINSIQLPQLTVRPGSFTEKIGMSLSGITDPNERAKLTSKSTKSVVISKVPVKLPSGELGYAVYDNGQLKGYQSEPPGTPMIDRSREIDKISKEVLKEINPSSVPRTDFSTKDLDPKLRFANELRELAGETDTSTPFGEDVAATREDAANLVEKYPFLQYLVPSQLAKKGIGAVYDYFYGPSKTLQKQYDAEDIPLPIGEDIAGIATNTGRLVDEYGTEDMDVFQPDTITSVAATPKQIFDLISQGTGPKGDPETVQQILRQMEIDRAITPENITQATGPKVKPEDMITRATLASKDIAQGTGPKVDEDVSKQFQQEVAEKEAAEQFAELNRLMAEGTGPKVPPEGRLSPEETSEDIAEGTGPKVPPEGRPETNKETKEAIVNQTNNIVETTTGSNLDQLMKEFTDKAPEYEGISPGLARMKIGFAIAAGKSADGIQNIADGFSLGADILIKDKSEKDAFNRQVKLSALQYGLGELSKERAEERLKEREGRGLKEFVVGKGGTTYNGKEYSENESVFVTISDIQKGKIPKNVLTNATIDTLIKQNKAFTEALNKKLEKLEIPISDYNSELEKYSKAVDIAIQSEVGVALLEGAMITVAEGRVTGITPAVKSLINKTGNFLGLDLSKDYKDREEVIAAMQASLQDLIPVTLGESQSANSISNRDVEFLITAFFGPNALNGGVLSFVTQDPKIMKDRLERAAEKMRVEQRKAFSTMNTVQNTLSPFFQPGTNVSALGGLSESQKRLVEAGLSDLNPTKTTFGYIIDDEGVYRKVR